jgi:hypothetical protein
VNIVIVGHGKEVSAILGAILHRKSLHVIIGQLEPVKEYEIKKRDFPIDDKEIFGIKRNSPHSYQSQKKRNEFYNKRCKK